MSFYDLTTNIFDKKYLNDNTSLLPYEQQVMIDFYGKDNELKVSSFNGEHWYKFWMMNDGTIVPVDYTHSTAVDDTFGSNNKYDDLLNSGAIRGHINSKTGEINIEYVVSPTDKQIGALKQLVIYYNIKQITINDYDAIMLKSPDYVEYLINYGPVSEKMVNEEGSSIGSISNDSSGTTEDHISYIPIKLGEKGKNNKKRKKFRFNKNNVKESVDDNIKRLHSELKINLVKLFNGKNFLLLVNHYDIWKSVFGIKKYRTVKTSVTIENFEYDIKHLYKMLINEYGNDRGNLELLIASIQNERPLGQFDVFNKFDTLYGTRIESSYESITLVFEGTVDFIYDYSESVYIDDDEILDVVEEEFGDSIKRSRKLIYPVGGKFRVGFFNKLKNLIIQDNKVENKNE